MIRSNHAFEVWHMAISVDLAPSRRRSWPQAASMARPFVLRTVTLTLPSRRIVVNRLMLSGIRPVVRQTCLRDCTGSDSRVPGGLPEGGQALCISRPIVDATQ